MSMKILIISTVMSKRVVDVIRKHSLNKGGQSIQKFFFLVAQGLSRVSDAEVKVYSIPPVSPGNYSKKWVRIKADKEDQVSFSYQNVLNLPLVKSLLSFIQTFFYIVKEVIRGKVNVIVLDALKVYPSLAALLAGKILRKPVVAILTDVPGLDVFTDSWMKRLNTKISFRVLRSFDAYVFLTEPTNTLINQKQKPYIIMEGLIDSSEELPKREEVTANKVILYSGGLYEKYGIKMLMDAVVKSKHKGLELHLYGDGPMVDTILKYHRDYPNISFFGNVPNFEMVNYQAQADLLINPRFTGQEYTLYTFPSKNLEYMASGTPLMTTQLIGIPKDHYPHVYLIENETIEGLSLRIDNFFDLPQSERLRFGKEARNFVLKNKNQEVQGNRIFSLIENLTKA